jgi:alpha/beta superfamily hydrolase
LKLRLINGCDHFYGGFSQELKKIISDYLIN